MHMGQDRKIFLSLLISRQNHSKLFENSCSLSVIMIYYGDKKLKKGFHVLEADAITNKTNIDSISLAQRMPVLLVMFQMTAIALVSIINQYHINGLHLFWETLYLL